MRVFDLALLNAKCPEGTSESPLPLLDRLDQDDQLFEIMCPIMKCPVMCP